MEWNAAVQKVLRYLVNRAVCCKGRSEYPETGWLQKKAPKTKLLMNYMIKTSHSTRHEIVRAGLFSAHAWKNANLSKNLWVNLRKENDCAWKCFGDGVCQLMKWEAAVWRAVRSKDAGRLRPKQEIFGFSSSTMNAWRFCFVWLYVAGQEVTITHATRFQFAFSFAGLDDKPSPLGFVAVAAALPPGQGCSMQKEEQLEPKSTYQALAPDFK